MKPAERLKTYVDENRLIRNAWTGTDAQGRRTACLLAALAPATGTKQSVDACPANIMPTWLAHLTPWMDDNGSLVAWPGMVRRYASVASRWRVISTKTWSSLDFAARRIAVAEAICHLGPCSEPDFVTVAKAALNLCGEAESGHMPTKAAWLEVDKAADAALVKAGADTKLGQSVVDWAVVKTASVAVKDAGRRLASRRAWITLAVVAMAAGAASLREEYRAHNKGLLMLEAKEAAADRMTAAILDAIEIKIIEAGGPKR